MNFSTDVHRAKIARNLQMHDFNKGKIKKYELLLFFKLQLRINLNVLFFCPQFFYLSCTPITPTPATLKLNLKVWMDV